MPDFNTGIIYVTLFTSLFFEVFLLITYLERREHLKAEESRKRNEKRTPSVTVIVPCFNEERTILKTIFSLLSLEYPSNRLSILIVDDGSTDHTLRVLSRFRKHPQIRIYSKANGGKHTALNFALEHTTSDLVGCLDADSFVDSKALGRIVTYFEDPEVMAVTPAIKVHEPKGLLQLIQKVEYAWGIFLRKMLSYLGAIYVTPGPFSIFRTKVFAELGTYRHAHHTEDFEMALRMQKHHYKIVNAHDAHVYTVAPTKLKTLYKQRLRWTYGFLNNMIDYRFLLFKKEYGHLGMYILPMATIAILSAVYTAGLLIWSTGAALARQWEKIQTVGIHMTWPKISSFDWFFLNTDALILLTLFAGIFIVGILFISQKLAGGKARPSLEMLYFLSLYGFLAPLWLFKALYNTLFAKKISWR